MSYYNNNEIVTSSPNAITTLLTKPGFVSLNNLTLYNFHCTDSNPLNLPFSITIEYIYTGTLVGGVVKGSCKGFCTTKEKESSVRIDCRQCFMWYVYGSVCSSLVNNALQNPNDTANVEILDAYVHTLSFKDAVNFVYSNSNLWIIGLIDCQMREIGFSDFLRYKLNQIYDPQKVAQFLTIMNYLCPNFVTNAGFQLSPYQEVDKTFIYYYLQVANIPFLAELITDIENEINKIKNELSTDFFNFVSQESSEFEEFIDVYYQRFIGFISELESLSKTSEIGQFLSELTEGVYNFISPLITQTVDNFGLIVTLIHNYLKEKIGKIQSEIQKIIRIISSEIPSPPSVNTSLSSAKKYVSEIEGIINQGFSEIDSLYGLYSIKFNKIISYLQRFITSLLQIPYFSEVYASEISTVATQITTTVSEFSSEWTQIGSMVNGYLSEFEADVSDAYQMLTVCSNQLISTTCYSSELSAFYNDVTGLLDDVLNVLGSLLQALIPIITIKL